VEQSEQMEGLMWKEKMSDERVQHLQPVDYEEEVVPRSSSSGLQANLTSYHTFTLCCYGKTTSAPSL